MKSKRLFLRAAIAASLVLGGLYNLNQSIAQAQPAVAPAATQPASSPATTQPAGYTWGNSGATPGAATLPGPGAVVDPVRKEADRLTAEVDLRAKKFAIELANLKEENDRLRTQYELAQQKQKNELLKLQLERDQLVAEAALSQAQRDKEITVAKRQVDDLQTQQQLRDLKLTTELANAKAELQRLETQRQLAESKQKDTLADLDRQRTTLAAQNALELEKQRAAELALEAAGRRYKVEMANAQARGLIRDADNNYRNEVAAEIQYRKDPFVNGVLYISDRRIALDGPIISGTADYVTDRLAYFNNQSTEYPIFIVINNSPGGSVMQGYRIVKAMQASTAPVHVVVKSFAASMAAIITTLAPRSYAYPNAIILHHQMGAGVGGNMSMLEEEMERLKEWQRRLAEPVAQKMGITPQEFVDRMYKKSKSTGDWQEFADKAIALKWVDQVVNEIREEGIRKKPVGDPPKPWYWFLFNSDSQGNTYCKLPPLDPGDAYFLHNTNNFYR